MKKTLELAQITSEVYKYQKCLKTYLNVFSRKYVLYEQCAIWNLTMSQVHKYDKCRYTQLQNFAGGTKGFYQIRYEYTLPIVKSPNEPQMSSHEDCFDFSSSSEDKIIFKPFYAWYGYERFLRWGGAYRLRTHGGWCQWMRLIIFLLKT